MPENTTALEDEAPSDHTAATRPSLLSLHEEERLTNDPVNCELPEDHDRKFRTPPSLPLAARTRRTPEKGHDGRSRPWPPSDCAPDSPG
jgi:hypothetical protein